MLSRATKEEMVRELNESFKANPALFVVEYKGLKVKEIEGLRKRLKEADAELRVVKNTVLRIASKDTDAEKVQDLFVGPTAVAICAGEPAPVAKIFTSTVKAHPLLIIRGGVVEGSRLSEEDIVNLSKLPSREVLLAQLLGLLSSPVSNFLGVLGQMQSRVVDVLTSLKEKKEKEENG